MSVPKKTLVIYAGIVIPHGFWKITQYKEYVSSGACKTPTIHMLSLNNKNMNKKCICADQDSEFKRIYPLTKMIKIFIEDILPFYASPKNWDQARKEHYFVYCNPVFGILCSLVKKIFSSGHSSKSLLVDPSRCTLSHLHLNKTSCGFCPKK